MPAQQAKRAADCAASGDASRGAFRCLGVLFMGEFTSAVHVRHENRNVVVRKAIRYEPLNGIFRLGNRLIDAKYGSF